MIPSSGQLIRFSDDNEDDGKTCRQGEDMECERAISTGSIGACVCGGVLWPPAWKGFVVLFVQKIAHSIFCST